jgi:hypothetical protein
MKHLQILISVDERKLRLQREELDNPFSLEEAVQNEFGWLCDSGVYLDKICGHALSKNKRARNPRKKIIWTKKTT